MRAALIAAALATLLVLPPPGHRLITSSDEARFALLARDMVERGVGLGARVLGEVYRNTPPLY